MTTEEPKIEGFSLEDHIACLQWSDEATEHDKTLVIGNLRTLYYEIAEHLSVRTQKAPLMEKITIFEKGFLSVSLPRGYPNVLQFEIEHPTHGGSSCGLARIEIIALRNCLNEWLEQLAVKGDLDILELSRD